MEGICYCCGKPGHQSPDCRQKEKTPREEWEINKSQSHAGVASGSTVESKSQDGDKSTASSITGTSDDGHV